MKKKTKANLVNIIVKENVSHVINNPHIYNPSKLQEELKEEGVNLKYNSEHYIVYGNTDNRLGKEGLYNTIIREKDITTVAEWNGTRNLEKGLSDFEELAERYLHFDVKKKHTVVVHPDDFDKTLKIFKEKLSIGISEKNRYFAEQKP